MANSFPITAILAAASPYIHQQIAEGEYELRHMDKHVEKVILGSAGYTWVYFEANYALSVPDDTELLVVEVEQDYKALTSKQRIAIGRLAMLTQYNGKFMPRQEDRQKHMAYLLGCGYVKPAPLGEWALKYGEKERETYQRYEITERGRERVRQLFPKYSEKK